MKKNLIRAAIAAVILGLVIAIVVISTSSTVPTVTRHSEGVSGVSGNGVIHLAPLTTTTTVAPVVMPPAKTPTTTVPVVREVAPVTTTTERVVTSGGSGVPPSTTTATTVPVASGVHITATVQTSTTGEVWASDGLHCTPGPRQECVLLNATVTGAGTGAYEGAGDVTFNIYNALGQSIGQLATKESDETCLLLWSWNNNEMVGSSGDCSGLITSPQTTFDFGYGSTFSEVGYPSATTGELPN